MLENTKIKEAVEKLDRISEDEEMQRIAELREKAIRDEKATYARGIEIGEKQGEERGVKKEKIEIAKGLLKAGIDIKIISQTTGLTKEEIEKLK